MIEKIIKKPDGKIYMTAWLDAENGTVKFKFTGNGYTVRMDRRVASDLAQFFTEVNFYNFCKEKK